jgi:hypothetical protein
MGTLAPGISRRGLFGSALALGLPHVPWAGARGALFAHSEVTHDLQPPLTLGIARVVLQPGAVSQSVTQGLRMITVESGVVAVGMPRSNHAPISVADLSASPRTKYDLVELIMATGTSLSADNPGVMSLRNPGAGSAVILDVVVYREIIQPLPRAFTSDDVSFQLLASAVSASAPEGGAAIRLERTWLAPKQILVQAAGTGVMVGYLERGAVQVLSQAGQVATGRAATAAPYSLPGALTVLEQGRERLVSAGGMVFVPQDGASIMKNTERRDAVLLVLSVLAA